MIILLIIVNYFKVAVELFIGFMVLFEHDNCTINGNLQN